MIDVPDSSFQLRAGPVEVDTARLGPELMGLAGVLALLVLFRLGIKLVGRL